MNAVENAAAPPADAAAGLPSPRAVRFLGAASVALQVGVLWYITAEPAVGVSLAVLLWAAAIGLRVPGARWLRSSPAYVVLAVLMLAKINFAPYDISEFRGYLGTNLAYEVATFLVLSQIGMLFGFSGGRLPAVFGAAGGFAMFLLSDIQVGPKGHVLMLVGVLTYVALAVGQYRLGRRSVTGERVGWLPIAASGLIALSLGGGVAYGLAKYNRQIERSLLQMMGMTAARASTGFSTTGELTTVSERRAAGDDRVAIRVEADAPPGYLNGQSLVTYNGFKWSNPAESLRPVGPVENPQRLPGAAEDDLVFATEGHTTFRPEGRDFEAAAAPGTADPPPSLVEPDVPAGVGAAAMTLWPEPGQQATYFRPPGRSFLRSQTPAVQMDPYGNATVEEDLLGQPYTVWAVEVAEGNALLDWQRDAYLQVPRSRRQRLTETLDRTLRTIFGPGMGAGLPARRKAAAVEAYFAENYAYRLGTDATPGARRDKTEWFLNERREGHCEFFASATCLLLRAAGVPTRYAVGFVAEERNTVGGYWLARNRDAHAWCEAYDGAAGTWFVVESTPSSGVPAGGQAGGWTGLADAVRLSLRRWQDAWRQRDLKADLAAASSRLASPATLLAIGLLAGSLAGWLRFRQRRTDDRPQLRPLTDVVERFDRFAARQGFARRPGETLRQFADRAAADGRPWGGAARDWVRDYGLARYRAAAAGEPTEEAAAALRGGLGDLRAAAKRKRPAVADAP